MKILFITKKKSHKYALLLEKSVMNAIDNTDFNLANDLIDLTYDICGVYGISVAKKQIESEEDNED